MKNNLLVCALLTCGLALPTSLFAAPTQIEVVDNKDREFTTQIETDENDITHVTIKTDGKQHDLAFTAQELKDKDVISAKLAELPKESQTLLTRMLSRSQLHPKNNLFVVNAEQDKAIKIKLEKLYKQLDGKTAQIEAHVIKIESKSGELEAKAQELEKLFEQNEGEFEIHIESLSDDIEIIAEQISELEVMRFGDSDEHASFVIFDDDDGASAEHILSLISHANLSKEDKQKLKSALDNIK
ncbi:hypothetical protein [Shewanella sp. GutDb-MelDb]|uniref:hypothetical protein n=1 Tax=Shewanella sp. GutDb-MelDb TaxID=2058316 RepID=UPI000C7ACAF3|nr:hypothetical protein [Shewanella sp. GutDb-MelDb]PKG59287.1 hypothetical protein CXF82_00055 [Shewanella sp. GutDb-MelDb]